MKTSIALLAFSILLFGCVEPDISKEKEIRGYLFEKYEPQGCIGMPPSLLFNPEKDISLTQITENRYVYSFTDGRCCMLYDYRGIATLNPSNNSISDEIISKTERNVPC